MSMLILLNSTRRRGSRQSHTITAALPDDGDAVFFWGGQPVALLSGRFAVVAQHARRKRWAKNGPA